MDVNQIFGEGYILNNPSSLFITVLLSIGVLHECNDHINGSINA